jgi:hypothetical protein
MSDLNIDELLPTLEHQAQRLNEASDRANAALAAVEKRLVRANIGLEYWHHIPLDASDTTGDLAPHATSEYTKQVFGFARIGGKWCLAVKAVRTVHGFYEGEMSQPYQNEFVDAEPTPLLSASRALRVAAVGAMPDFLARFTIFVAKTVEAVDGTVATITKSHTK